MKLLVAITVCLALTCTTQGSFMDDLKLSFSHIGDAFTQTFHQMGQQATDVGNQLLNQAAEQGKQLLGQTAHSLLVGTINAFTGTSAPPAATKRDLSAVTQQLQPYLNLAQQTIDAKSSQLQGLFQSALGRLEEISHQIPDLSPAEISAKVDSVVSSHGMLAGHFLHDLQSVLATHQKRNALSDTLSTVGNNIVSLFASHVHAVNNILDNAGSLIKQQSQSVAQSMAETLSTLGGKLGQQLSHMGTSGDVIINQGTNALNTLKGVASALTHQAMSNVHPDVLN
ncbi:uncharacterized protein LOC132563235 [Ylistrum balloti]|uniref:uncharacterized protein LOC132563235 n=1 Tax=Ylistrum balloti TaxID=509963 RepID=UPI002905F5BE|nr:uncharacterized protein LOC132563235 [Ylistrum balloti]